MERSAARPVSDEIWTATSGGGHANKLKDAGMSIGSEQAYREAAVIRPTFYT
jgi:hypothetical protein